ncbi:MAG: hypothetical protein ABTQ28_15585, partial [Thauera sp.]
RVELEVSEGGGAGELRAAARTRGHRSLAEDGLRRVLDGSTSLAELARVVDLSGVDAGDIARLTDEARS